MDRRQQIKTDAEIIVVVGAALALAVFFYVKKSGGVAALAADAGAAAVKAVDGAVGGVVMGIGDAIGVPRTDADKCAQYLAAGETWKAGLYCPASTFLPYLVGMDTPEAQRTTEIHPDGETYGWRYFSDGTAISPDGTYYKNGQMIWN